MTAVNEAGAAARRAASSRTLERLTRFGLIGFGVIHLLVGWIAVQIASGDAPAEGDQAGAFKTVAAQPVGKALLIAVLIGLIAMTAWQILAAAVGHRDETGRERQLERVASAGRAAFYAYLAFKAGQVVNGSTKSAGDTQQETTARLMAADGGRVLVGLIGLAVIAIGAGMIWYGLVKRFEKHLKSGQMTARTRKVVRSLGVAGYIAKGVAYGILGILVLVAAVKFDPSRSRGLDSALRTLAAQNYGDLLLTMVALGIAAYGVFCLFQAKYRKV